MTLGTKSILALTLGAALFGAACKKKADDAAVGSGSATGSAAAGSGSGTATAAPPAVDAAEAAPPAVDAAEAAAAAATTPELKALDEAIAAIMAIQDEAERTKAACKALDDIRLTKVRAVAKAPPAGVDPMEWNTAAEGITGALEEFAIECGEGSAFNTRAMTAAIEARKEFDTLLAKKAP